MDSTGNQNPFGVASSNAMQQTAASSSDEFVTRTMSDDLEEYAQKGTVGGINLQQKNSQATIDPFQDKTAVQTQKVPSVGERPAAITEPKAKYPNEGITPSFSQGEPIKKITEEVTPKKPLQGMEAYQSIDFQVNQPNISRPEQDGKKNRYPQQLDEMPTFETNPSFDFIQQKKDTPPKEGETKLDPIKTFPAQQMPAVSMQKNEKPVFEEKFSHEDESRGGSIFYKTALILSVVLVIGILGAGGYYFLITKSESPQENSTPIATNPEPPIEQKNPEPPVSIEPPIEKYSTSKANYLSIDMNQATPEMIKLTIFEAASDPEISSTKLPYEFIITDKNNAPVSFPIFSSALSFGFNKSILDNLGESFSYFFFKDGDTVKLGLRISLKNRDALSKELVKQENMLPKFLSPLLPGQKSTSSLVPTFKSSAYKNFSIRYYNLNKEETYSIDYSLTENYFIIGTSRNTLRSILDKIQ